MQTDTINHLNTLLVPFDLNNESVNEFSDRLQMVINKVSDKLYLDCKDLDPVQSSHIGLLWLAWEECYKSSVKIQLNNTNKGLNRTLHLLDLGSYFELDDNSAKYFSTEYTSIDNNSQKQIFNIEFNADIDAINSTSEQFMSFLNELDISEEFIFDLKTLFYEVVTNIRLHSGLKPSDMISFQADPSAKEINLIFKDRGIYFNPLANSYTYSPMDSAKMRKTRGYGIVLINKLADELSYEREADTINRLIITKRFEATDE